MQLNLHHLRVFYTVVRSGSFSEAANTLFISQPAVSKALRELEDTQNLALIDRGGRGRAMQLTQGGEVLYEYAKEIFVLEKAALDDIHARAGLQRGTLVIGASTTIAAYWLAPYLAHFRRLFPDIYIDLRVANTQIICQWLLDCEIDTALVEGFVEHQQISSRQWQDDPMVVVASPAMNVTAVAATLNQQLWLLREQGSGTGAVVRDILTQNGVEFVHTMTLGSNEAIAHAASQGLGIALLPKVVVADMLELNRLQSLSLPNLKQLSRQLSYLRYQKRPLSPAAAQFNKVLFNDAAV